MSVFHHQFDQMLDHLGDWNPQLLRELKSRLKTRNLWLLTTFGVISQVLFYFFFRGFLPSYNRLDPNPFNRYCLGSPPPGWNGYQNYPSQHPIFNNFCVLDLLGHKVINWQLWWLDLFITISLIGIITLLVAGTFLLINDLAQEESKGTLNFIRLSPQSARTIFLGKLLGVPILLYGLALMTLPLHLWAGWMAQISLPLILAFYLVLLASCAFFYHIALLVGLMGQRLVGLQTFATSSSLFLFLFLMTLMSLWNDDVNFHSPLNWINLFYPGQSLGYLVQSTFLPFRTVNYFSEPVLTSLKWYGQPVFANAWTGIGFMLMNYGIWTYGLTLAINRRFRSSQKLFLSKIQSYGLTLAFVILGLGFVPQEVGTRQLYFNFVIFQFLLFGFIAVLSLTLSSERPILQLWARYRHQQPAQVRHLWQDYLLGEQSPANLAIAVNLGIIFLYVTPAILLFPLENYRWPVWGEFILGLSITGVYAVIYQRILLLNTRKRQLFALGVVGLLVITPIWGVIVSHLHLPANANLWFLTFLPMIAGDNASPLYALMILLGEWTVMLVCSLEMNRHLQKIGRSDTQQLHQGLSRKALNFKS